MEMPSSSSRHSLEMDEQGSSTPRANQRNISYDSTSTASRYLHVYNGITNNTDSANNFITPASSSSINRQNSHGLRLTMSTPPTPSSSSNLNEQNLDADILRRKTVIQAAENNVVNNSYLSDHLPSLVANSDDPFVPSDPRIHDEIIRMIEQWLTDEGLHASALVLNGEAQVKKQDREQKMSDCKLLRRAILNGEWNEIEGLVSRPLVKSQKTLMYSIYKQQFLEHIEHREIQKAFTLLTKRLKSLEHYQPQQDEFKDLCYLLSTQSILDTPSFKGWEGIQRGREKVVELLHAMIEREVADDDDSPPLPPHRLLHLLKQAAYYQISTSKYQSTRAPIHLKSLLKDYEPYVMPNSLSKTFGDNERGIKCMSFLGTNGRYIASGAWNGVIQMWDSNSGNLVKELPGHHGRVWDIDASETGSMMASGSADKTIKIWSCKQDNENSGSKLITSLPGNKGDVYSVCLHSNSKNVSSAGYDKIVRLYDIETSSIIKTFTGHSLGASDVITNPLGNLLISGSKDATIRIWDIVSGLCIKSITSHLGEVTSVRLNSDGTKLLTSSKDNAHRLWDMRSLQTLVRFKGHQNTSKHFIKANFLHNSLIASGSEDGMVYLWDEVSSEPVQILDGHAGVSYRAEWNTVQGLLATCGDDGQVKTWTYDPTCVK